MNKKFIKVKTEDGLELIVNELFSLSKRIVFDNKKIYKFFINYGEKCKSCDEIFEEDYIRIKESVIDKSHILLENGLNEDIIPINSIDSIIKYKNDHYCIHYFKNDVSDISTKEYLKIKKILNYLD